VLIMLCSTFSSGPGRSGTRFPKVAWTHLSGHTSWVLKTDGCPRILVIPLASVLVLEFQRQQHPRCLLLPLEVEREPSLRPSLHHSLNGPLRHSLTYPTPNTCLLIRLRARRSLCLDLRSPLLVLKRHSMLAAVGSIPRIQRAHTPRLQVVSIPMNTVLCLVCPSQQLPSAAEQGNETPILSLHHPHADGDHTSSSTPIIISAFLSLSHLIIRIRPCYRFNLDLFFTFLLSRGSRWTF